MITLDFPMQNLENPPFPLKVRPALDTLWAQRSHEARNALNIFANKRVGLLFNHTAQTQNGIGILQVLRALEVKVCALFSPEHGVAGRLEGHVASIQTPDGLPIHSLYGDTRRPTPEMLQGIDILVCDIQDVGARFYTYSTTLAYCLEECARHGIAVVVLDRPNPLSGVQINGPRVVEDGRSFVGYLRVPIQHGLTWGELALWHQRDAGLDVDLHVLPVEGWTRAMTWPQTGLKWTPPSPNLPDYQAAAWYPALCLLEFSGVAVGRGTNAPFQIVGAPWLEPEALLEAMQEWPDELRQVRGETIIFTSQRALFEGEACRGVRFSMRDESAFPARPVDFGLALLAALHHTHPAQFELAKSLPLLGSPQVLQALQANDVATALQLSQADEHEFAARREDILIYR